MSDYWECLTKYDKENNEIIKKEGNYPIFVDTNFLLKYYEISLESRKKLYEFIDTNKSRIYITKHVEKEFIKNREKTINNFKSLVTNEISKEFKNVTNKIDSFIKFSKKITNDNQSIKKGLDALEKKASELEKLIEDDFKSNYNFDIFRNDDYMNLIINCNSLNNLDESELTIIRKHFNDLEKNLTTLPVDKNPDLRFPGCGDLGKERNKEGDFIIYHEILKHLVSSNSSVIFLSYDSNKSDWFDVNKKSVMHYVYNSFYNTSHIIHIIDAERYLPDIYDIEINKDVNEITIVNIDYE